MEGEGTEVHDQDDAGTPAGGGESVTITRAEHARLQHDARKARKEAERLKAATEDAERKRQQDELSAQGKHQEAVQLAEQARAKAEAKAAQAAVRAAVMEEVVARGFTGGRAKALRKMVDLGTVQVTDGDPLEASVKLAVDAAMAEAPELFGVADEDGGGEEPSTTSTAPAPKAKPRRPTSPSTPVPSGPPFDGFLSQEEYTRTPQVIRLAKEFQARAKKSAPFWPEKVPVSTFQQGNE